MTQTVSAKLNHLRIAPRKVRAVAGVVRGLSINEAIARISLMPRRSNTPLYKLLCSALANAENNFKLKAENLYVKEIRVDQGPKSRRWNPRARGNINPIDKKTSHVALLLGVIEKPNASKFIIKTKKAKKISKPVSEKNQKEKTEDSKIESKVQKTVAEKKSQQKEPGFFKKRFQRKAMA